MRALVTRPAEDSGPLAAELRRRGIEVVLEPMLRVELAPPPRLDLDGVQALLFTSANGVRAFAAAAPVRHLPVFAVGKSTARAAREAGFREVETAAGDVERLAALVADRLDPAAGALFHAAGSVVAGDLAGRLGAAGFEVRRTALYEAHPAESLSPAAREALWKRDLAYVLFFSPRTAATFVRLVRAAGVAPDCAAVTALCLSPAVAEATAELPWREVRVAPRPEQEALLAELDAALARGAGVERRTR